MPVLKNARHEKFAQALASGKTADASYKLAGYKPDRGAATRLSAKVSIKDRVRELQQRQVDKVNEYAAVNVREEMQILRSIIADARQNGDLKTALDGQKFLLTCFGYADLPTLTHEHMTDRRQTTAAAPPTEERLAEVVKKNVLQFGRVHQELERLAGPRTIDHDPNK